MKLYSNNEQYKLYQGNMLDMLEIIEPNSIDSIITDPPYELNFMGKGWDNSGIAFQKETWQKCYEVLKPGGYLLAFGGSRTFHRIACAIEDAGFEIRDTIMWLYGSGFPKSMNIGLAIDKKNGVESEIVGYADTTMPDFRDVGQKQKELIGIDKLTFGQIENSERKEQPIYKASNKWDGWGTCLKPAFEPIIVARKPFKGSLVDNVIEYGIGGINIDECRVGNEHFEIKDGSYDNNENQSCFGNIKRTPKEYNGRFPANTIFTYDINDFQEVLCGFNTIEDKYMARYFYTAKASKKDRDEGLDDFEEKNTMCDRNPELASANMPQNRSGNLRKNTHPTVKPTELMQYLVRLVTPNDGIILDPFNGSGSTGKAVMYENREKNKNYKYIGIELTEEYLPISKARIEYVCNLNKEQVKEMQISIFDL